ncbi:hypothetical protein VNI00_010438 [Paramarasmius palmivorus]|uniref:Uncharacterized protein n=1 Tax=Paramarasmius palmivorus TaxID=297713 RepID=A0AAW0CGW5_9AGAR
MGVQSKVCSSIFPGTRLILESSLSEDVKQPSGPFSLTITNLAHSQSKTPPQACLIPSLEVPAAEGIEQYSAGLMPDPAQILRQAARPIYRKPSLQEIIANPSRFHELKPPSTREQLAERATNESLSKKWATAKEKLEKACALLSLEGLSLEDEDAEVSVVALEASSLKVPGGDE